MMPVRSGGQYLRDPVTGATARVPASAEAATTDLVGETANTAASDAARATKPIRKTPDGAVKE